MAKQLTAKRYQRIQQLHELKDNECDKALAAIERNDYITYLCHEAGARAIGKQISKLLDTWFGV